jgi:hypothetical protein
VSIASFLELDLLKASIDEYGRMPMMEQEMLDNEGIVNFMARIVAATQKEGVPLIPHQEETGLARELRTPV